MLHIKIDAKQTNVNKIYFFFFGVAFYLLFYCPSGQ